jgi:dTDP-4-amino-4,6-dideoxygalactose transaminase
MKIPFNCPPRLGTEALALKAVAEGTSWAGDGPSGRLCEKWLTEHLGLPGVLTTSATHALEIMALVLDLRAGDEVILPSYTFVTSASAFTMRGATVVFADCDANGQICLQHVQKLISSKTKAIVAVHYAGYSCDLSALQKICLENGIRLLEDGAQSIGGVFGSKPLCTFGDLACLSFHETKNIACGEGGALVVRDPKLYERVLEIREKGTNRHAFKRGIADKYTWREQGSSYVLSEFNAAVLNLQLNALSEIQKKRMSIVTRYRNELTPLLPRETYFLKPNEANGETGHMAAIVFANPQHRTAFTTHCGSQDVQVVSHYVCLHQSPFAQSHAELFRLEGDYLNTQKLASGLVRLPVYFNLGEDDLGRVIEVCKAALRSI